MSVEYDLITTNLKSKKKNNNKFFIGSWCLDYEKSKKVPEHLVMGYHWDNKQKLINDYKYLNQLHKKLINQISFKLEKELNLNYKSIFWKIYLGPWLKYYIQTTFDRWETVNSFFKKYGQNFKTVKFKYNEKDFVFFTLDEFIYNLCTDNYNHIIFNKIISYKLNNKKENFYEDDLRLKPAVKSEKNNIIKNSILELYIKLFSPILKKQKIFIFQTYLSKFEEVVLNLKLKQVPNIFFSKLKVKKKNFIKYDKNLRKKIFDFNLQEKSFENFLLSNLYFFLPTQFLENFKNIKKLSDNLPFPKEPKIIFTSHGLSNYTLSKFYIADKVNSGSKLIHGQHGGVYGIDYFTSHEEYERDISNLYLTWGWKEDNKTIPVGILKPIEKISRIKKNINLQKNNLLYVLRSRSRYSVNLLHSDIRSSQILKYYDENIELISNLRKEIRNSLLLRLHSRKYGWDEDKRFLEKNNDIKIDNGYEKIFKLINNSKLVLFTYNATGYLETLASNVPTIVYFNSKDNLIRANSEPFFEQLKKVNIFFDDIFKASNHINKVWGNIDLWWNDLNTQKARINFCNNYAKINNSKISFIKKIITKEYND